MLMHAQGEDRTLPVQLTAEELAAESQRLAVAVDAVAKQEDHIAEQKGLWAERKKSLEGYLSHLKVEMNTLAATVESGMAERRVPCSWLYALPQGFAFLVRDDDGSLVTHRELGDGERAAGDLEVIREPTPEQLSEWMEKLGLADRGEYQPGLPLAEPQGDPSALTPLPYHQRRQFVDAEGNTEAVVLRYGDAAKQPAQLTGVHVVEVRPGKAPFEGVVHNGVLEYADDPETLRHFREALEDELAARRPSASATDDLV